MYDLDKKRWLSQANHIFSRLQVKSNLADYVLLSEVHFCLDVGTTEDPPTGFLFLCPEEDFQAGPSSSRWPNCPTYWSFDASGVERLSEEEAARLGFPHIQLRTEAYGHSWDASVYAGLRQFHQAKGFEPESQDLAQHLGHELYQLSDEMEVPFAHVNEEDSDEDEGEINYRESNFEDTQSSDMDEHSSQKWNDNSVNTGANSSRENKVKENPAKRSFEELDENGAAKCQALGHKSTLLRLRLDERAQLIEMLRLGIFTKDEFKAELVKIEARYEVTTQMPPAKRLRLSSIH
ncbi:hypothetical protein B0H16DRAFT_1732688 [Mycena metata]|uniref:Uncharacterized protein n=1 Tax=Mycena metata TaxID=1033252 RepID=A0AAD7I2P0_9AGAR|nr:hypothetical protein B0H16DRAFT_1732688 [Mycena metata]